MNLEEYNIDDNFFESLGKDYSKYLDIIEQQQEQLKTYILCHKIDALKNQLINEECYLEDNEEAELYCLDIYEHIFIMHYKNKETDSHPLVETIRNFFYEENKEILKKSSLDIEEFLNNDYSEETPFLIINKKNYKEKIKHFFHSIISSIDFNYMTMKQKKMLENKTETTQKQKRKKL